MWRVPVRTQEPIDVRTVTGSKLETSSFKHAFTLLTGANPMQYIFSPATADRVCRIEAMYINVVDDVAGGASDVVFSLYGSSSLGRWQLPIWYAPFTYNANAWWYFAPGHDFGTVGSTLACYPLFDYLFNVGDWLQIDTVQSVDDQIVITILYREYWNKEV